MEISTGTSLIGALRYPALPCVTLRYPALQGPKFRNYVGVHLKPPGYAPRQTYAEAVDALALLFDARDPEDDLAVRARRFFENMPSKMFRLVMQESPQPGHRKLAFALSHRMVFSVLSPQ
jgi:hypothetical protein